MNIAEKQLTPLSGKAGAPIGIIFGPVTMNLLFFCAWKHMIINFFYSGCQKNVPIAGRFFVTTTYAAILFFGT